MVQASANRGVPLTEHGIFGFRFNAMLNIARLSTRSPTISISSRGARRTSFDMRNPTTPVSAVPARAITVQPAPFSYTGKPTWAQP